MHHNLINGVVTILSNHLLLLPTSWAPLPLLEYGVDEVATRSVRSLLLCLFLDMHSEWTLARFPLHSDCIFVLCDWWLLWTEPKSFEPRCWGFDRLLESPGKYIIFTRGFSGFSPEAHLPPFCRDNKMRKNPSRTMVYGTTRTWFLAYSLFDFSLELLVQIVVDTTVKPNI